MQTCKYNSNRNSSRSGSANSQSGKASTWMIWIVLILVIAGGGWWWKKHRDSAAAASAGGSASLSGPADRASGSASGRPAGAGGGGRRFGGGGANAPQPVSVQAVRRQDIHVSVDAIGSIAASNTAIVRSQVSGVLQAIHFKEGDQVRAGQSLAQIDPRAFQASLSQAEGALARDMAQLAAARVDAARYRDLLTKDAIPKQQLDTQLALVGQLEGTVKADQGTVDAARLQLTYTKVVAPISGRVGLKQADLGNVVQPSDTNGIVSITQTHPIALTFAVPSANVPLITKRLRARQDVPVMVFSRAASTAPATPLATGSVSTLDNAIDAATDTIKVKALFPNMDDALFPNQAVSVTLQLDTLTDVIAVPRAAVLRGAQGFYVYLVQTDKSVTMRVVKPGAVDNGWMAVEGQLQPGDQIVVDGTDRLREGAKVEVIVPQNDAARAPRTGASGARGERRGTRGAEGGASGPRSGRPRDSASEPAGNSNAASAPR